MPTGQRRQYLSTGTQMTSRMGWKNYKRLSRTAWYPPIRTTFFRMGYRQMCGTPVSTFLASKSWTLQLFLLEPRSDSGIPFCSIGLPHTVVVYPTCTEDVVKVVKIANKYRMPVIPYSGATSIEGQFLGVRPLLDLRRRRVCLMHNRGRMNMVVFALMCLAWIKFCR